MKRTAAFVVWAALVAATPAFAQGAGWTVEFGGGVAAPTSDISSELSTGLGIDAGVGYRFTQWFTMLGEVAFAGMDVPTNILQQLQAPQGQGRIYSLNVDPQVNFRLTTRLQGFVEGGVGVIRRTVELTAPMYQYVDSYDPFYGDFVQQPIENDQVLSSETQTAFAANVGGGVSLPLAITGVSLFIDVRYYRARTSPQVTSMIPVLFGIRYTASKTR
jgi:opacity protein-like surface antigen